MAAELYNPPRHPPLTLITAKDHVIQSIGVTSGEDMFQTGFVPTSYDINYMGSGFIKTNAAKRHVKVYLELNFPNFRKTF